MIVLDTHALVWWASAPGRLSRRAAASIDAADCLGIPTIVFWELSLLVRKRRLELDQPVSDWVTAICRIPRIEPLVLSTDIALRADALEMHADPVDRFIVATALAHGAPLLSKDREIRASTTVKVIW